MFYTVKEIATMLKVHEGTVRRWIRKGKLATVRVGDSLRVQEAEFVRFVNAK